MPGAVTISRGADWTEKRRLNDDALSLVLNRGLADRTRSIVGEVLERRAPSAGSPVRWSWFESVFQDIAVELIFGTGGSEGARAARELKSLMLTANRLVFLRRGRRLRRFATDLQRLVLTAPDESLVGLARRSRASGCVDVAQQVPHWMFAIQDTLAENVARAVALVASHPLVEERVRGYSQDGAWGSNGQSYLQGCLQEAMRLFPSTPMLVREVMHADVLGDAVVAPGDQIIIPNMMLHRNRSMCSDPDRFDPRRWHTVKTDFRFNHLSNGTQDCPGKDLALLSGTTVLGWLFASFRVRLERPVVTASDSVPYSLDVFSMSIGVAPIESASARQAYTDGTRRGL